MLKDWKAARGEYPAAFLEKPELPAWLVWYLDAWDDLGQSRRTDQGYPQPIPCSEILAYCTLFGIVWDDARADILYFCGRLDDVYCGYAGSKEEEKAAFILEMREKLKEDVD